MANTGPVPLKVAATDESRRKWREATIRIIDISISLAIFTSGWFALLATPLSVLGELPTWLVGLWGGLLLAGGLLGAIGRLTRIWAIELPGVTAAISGVAIYGVVISSLVPLQLGVIVALGLILVAFLAQFRRYIELQIFTTEPGSKAFTDRIQAILKRRTPDMPYYRI